MNHELPSHQYWVEDLLGTSSGWPLCCKSTNDYNFILPVERYQDSAISKCITTTTITPLKELGTPSAVGIPNNKYHEEVTNTSAGYEIPFSSGQQTDKILHNTRRCAECAFARVKVGSQFVPHNYVEHSLTGTVPWLARTSLYSLHKAFTRHSNFNSGTHG
jgi:hypothetical protein